MLLTQFLLLAGTAATAGLVQGIAGFGYGLVAMALMATMMPVSEATVLVNVAALVTSALNLHTVREHICWRETLAVLAAAIPTTVLGVYLLTALSESVLRAGLAVIVLAGCAVTLWRPVAAKLARPWPWAYVAGLLGGVFGGALSTGGPPITLYTLLRGWEKAEAKGLLSSYFVVSTAWRLLLLSISGVATLRLVGLGAILVVPSVLAAYLGTMVFRRMSTQLFRYATMVLLLGVAAKLLLT